MGRRSNVLKLGLPEIDGVRLHHEAGAWVGVAFDLYGKSAQRGGFQEPTDAYLWAKGERAKMMGGLPAGAVTMDACLAEWEKQAEKDGTGEDGRRLVRNLCNRLVAAGIRNVKAEDFRDRLKEWAAGLHNDWSYDAGKCPYKRRPLSARTRIKYATMVASVIEVARINNAKLCGLPFGNPALNLKPVKAKPKQPRPTFTIAELATLVSDKMRGDKWWRLNCALVYLGFRSYLAAHLRLEWFRFDQDHLQCIDPKTGHEITAYLQPEFKEIVLADIAERGMKPGDPGWWIEDPIIRATGSINPRPSLKADDEKTSDDSHSKAFDAMLERFGVPSLSLDGRKRVAHCTRHSFIALHQGRGNADISKIQGWVGHATRSMTTKTYGTQAERYAHAVRSWPGYSMCLRHAPDSPFHKPANPAADDRLTRLETMLAESLKANKRLMDRMLGAEAIVVLDDEPIPGPGAVSA